ncbi:protein kinase C theta type-like [Leptodactylus fuscus]
MSVEESQEHSYNGCSGGRKTKKKRGGKARLLKDDGPIPGSNQDPGTSSPYPDFYISRLTIHQVLGRGSFGKVVLASLPGRNTFVAVKVIANKQPHRIALRERQILQKTRDSPFICHLNAAHQSQDGYFFITEYLSGGSLEDLIGMCGSLNTDNVRFYTAEISCGLQFLHGHTIIHRDLKPGNIMLDGNGHIRIIDLGIARDGVTSSRKIRGLAGTRRYMAPEVLLGLEYDAAVDWWSLGIVVSIMATGSSPFDFYRNVTRDEPEIPTSLDAQLKDLLIQLLQKDPEKRLGVNNNIRDHPFFNIICWEELEMRRAQPPFTPFRAVLKNEDLPWPEDQTLHPDAEFNYMSAIGSIDFSLLCFILIAPYYVSASSKDDEEISTVKTSTTIWTSPYLDLQYLAASDITTSRRSSREPGAACARIPSQHRPADIKRGAASVSIEYNGLMMDITSPLLFIINVYG